MEFLNSFKQDIFSLNDKRFEEAALTLFFYQEKHNKIYHDYIEMLGIEVATIDRLEKIPFLPIDFYKHHQVISGRWEPEAIFQSSGTTDQVTSKHYMQDLAFYRKIATHIFENRYGDLQQFHILALLPSYLERNNASLVYMVEDFIIKSGSPHSGFFLNNTDQLIEELDQLLRDQKKVLLIGVTYALLDLIERYKFTNENADIIIMETGGMKGRRKEMTREELQEILAVGFKVKTIHSEYGMTELTSQAYATSHGSFLPPNWMKIMIREVNDPFQWLSPGKIGGVNIIDLANASSCAFIETKDLGRINQDGSFSIVGRFDNADLRGCNLMIG